MTTTPSFYLPIQPGSPPDKVITDSFSRIAHGFKINTTGLEPELPAVIQKRKQNPLEVQGKPFGYRQNASSVFKRLSDYLKQAGRKINLYGISSYEANFPSHLFVNQDATDTPNHFARLWNGQFIEQPKYSRQPSELFFSSRMALKGAEQISGNLKHVNDDPFGTRESIVLKSQGTDKAEIQINREYYSPNNNHYSLTQEAKKTDGLVDHISYRLGVPNYLFGAPRDPKGKKGGPRNHARGLSLISNVMLLSIRIFDQGEIYSGPIYFQMGSRNFEILPKRDALVIKDVSRDKTYHMPQKNGKSFTLTKEFKDELLDILRNTNGKIPVKFHMGGDTGTYLKDNGLVISLELNSNIFYDVNIWEFRNGTSRPPFSPVVLEWVQNVSDKLDTAFQKERELTQRLSKAIDEHHRQV